MQNAKKYFLQYTMDSQTPTSAILPEKVDGLPHWALILIIVGAVLIAVLSVVCGVWFFKRNRAKRNSDINNKSRENYVKDSLRGLELAKAEMEN